MKTALQNLIDKLNNLSPNDGDNIASMSYHNGIQWAIHFAEKMIEDERQQIVMAYNDGRYDGENNHIKTNWDNGEKYYQQSYQTPATGSGS